MSARWRDGFVITTRRTDLANLNTLRAFAVSAVLIDHLASLLITRHIIRPLPFLYELGRVGVLAFFVHTSLVLMLSLDRLPEYRKTVAFYIRRAFRIYPLSVLCVVLVVSLKIPGEPMTGGSFQFPVTVLLLANLLLVQNIIGHSSVTAAMWSLPYEVQMYVVLPLLHKLTQSRRAIGYLASLIVVFSLIGGVVNYLTGHANILGFIPCFLSGVLAYVLRDRRPFLPSVLWPIGLILWMVLLSWAMVAHNGFYFPITWASAVLLGVGVYYFHDSTQPVWNAATELTAKYSYGIYLAHVPVMWLVFLVLPQYNIVVSILIWLAITGAVSVAAYHLLEQPMIDAGRRMAVRLAPANPVLVRVNSRP